MIRIRLAELNIAVKNKYPGIEKFCRDYIVGTGETDFTVSASDDDIAAEIGTSVSLGRTPSPAYAESICVYREICKKLPEYNAFLFHSSVVECDGRAYAFAAASGTGKSTHTSLWLKHFGSRARIINGDKPIFRFTDRGLTVYGTPWCGKEGYNVNADAPLNALCFIERSETNSIRRIDTAEAVVRIFPQILIPSAEKDVDSLFPLLEKMLDTVPCFVLSCNISDEAVEVAYGAMKNV